MTHESRQPQTVTSGSAWWQAKWLVALLALLAACGVPAITFLLLTGPSSDGVGTGDPALSSGNIEDVKAALRKSEEDRKKTLTELESAKASIKRLRDQSLKDLKKVRDLDRANFKLAADKRLMKIERIQEKLKGPDDKTLRGWLTRRPYKSKAAALVGLSGCRILIEQMPKDSPISKAELRDVVEFQFRKAGVKIISESPPDALLYLNVNVFPLKESRNFVYSTSLYFDDLCVNVRTLNQLIGITWRSLGGTGIVPKDEAKKHIKEIVAEDVDKFLNDYLKANPK